MRNALLLLTGTLMLASCGDTKTAEDNLSAIDNQIARADIDPAITTAVQDQIMVDPALVGQANPNAVRQPERPLSAPYPPADQPAPVAPAAPGVQQASASRDVNGPIAGACGVPFQMGNDWAQRLPAEFPVYPNGQVTEAAGANAGACRMRAVSFTTADAPARVLAFYTQAASRAGYDAERQQKDGSQILGGTRGEGAYYLIVTPLDGGSSVDLIVNSGR